MEDIGQDLYDFPVSEQIITSGIVVYETQFIRWLLTLIQVGAAMLKTKN